MQRSTIAYNLYLARLFEVILKQEQQNAERQREIKITSLELD